MEITPATVEKSENQNENPSNEKQIVEADITSTRDVAAGDAPNNNKNGSYQKKRPYNPAYKRYAIPWVTKFPMALHEEIWSFSQWLTPTTEEQTMRQDVVNRLRKIVEKLWEGATVVPYGSFETNLCVPTSDIDVVIFGAQPIDDRSPLTILAEALEQEELPSKPPKVIASAKVPIVKFHDRKSGCLVDISFDITTGIANTKIIKEFLNQYPLLRPLALVIKFYLKQRYLNDTWSGGIGSYTLIMMIISYLQLHTKSKGQIPQSDDAPNGSEENNNNNNDNNDVPAPHDETKEDLASMLTGFFELYGSKFDYLTNVISILDGGKYLSKEEKKWVHTDALDALAVEDPQNPDNDVGLACFKIKEAKKAFADAFTMLTGPKKYLSESLLGKLVRVPLSLVQQRQRIKSSSGREQLPDETSEANIETQGDVDPEEKRLTYNYQNRYKSYSRNNEGWYHNKPPTASNNNTNQQSNTNHRAESGTESSTTAQRAPSHNNNNSTYLPPHRRQQQARAPAPANTNSGGSSTVSSAGTSPTNSTLLAISVPLVVPALSDKTANNNNNNNRNNTQQQRKGSYQNNSSNSNTNQGSRSNNNSHHLNTHKTSNNSTTSHSPASTSPRVTSSNNPSNTPVHSGHNNGNSNNNRQNSASQNRSGSNNNNRANNNRNNNNSNRGRSTHNNHNNNANIIHDDEIKNDELNFPTLSKDPTVHENKIAQKSSTAPDTSSNRSQHVNNNTINGNNGAGQQQQNGNNKSDGKKGGKRRQNTVLISA